MGGFCHRRRASLEERTNCSSGDGDRDDLLANALYREWYASLAPIRSLVRWQMDKYAARSVFKPVGFVSYLRATWERYPEFAQLLAHAKGRRLARTERGRLCLVPADVKEGDAVVLVKGGRVPLVIRYERAEQDGSHSWRLVGECCAWSYGW
jgi:hypothetical protein